MSGGTNCFDLFWKFYGVLAEAESRTGYCVSERTKAAVWLAMCNEERWLTRQGSCCHQHVKKSRPVEVREMSIVKSCKRKVRW